MSDPFFEPYDRDDIAYGDRPSAALVEYLNQTRPQGPVVDLGAGAGRDTIALARAGCEVTAVDLSERGLQRIHQRAEDAGVGHLVQTRQLDVREFPFDSGQYAGVIATTVLDHIPATDADALWRRITAAITSNGFLYVQVHTTEDPGSDRPPGSSSDQPVSETAAAVINYFSPNQLASWATRADSDLRVLRYEERLEWDYTHGPEHLHGKAVLLAVRNGHHPNWFGQPPAFPKKPPAADG